MTPLLDACGHASSLTLGHTTCAGEAWAVPGRLGERFIAYLNHKRLLPPPERRGNRKDVSYDMLLCAPPSDDMPRKTRRLTCRDCGQVFYTSARAGVRRCVACADNHEVESKQERDTRKWRREHGNG